MGLSSDEAEEAARRLKSLKIEAVSLYSKRKYEDAESKFRAAIELVKSINPNHKEIDALMKSIESCRSKSGVQPETASRKEEAISHPLLDKLRQELASRGARGFAGLQRRFASMDVRHSYNCEYNKM